MLEVLSLKQAGKVGINVLKSTRWLASLRIQWCYDDVVSGLHCRRLARPFVQPARRYLRVLTTPAAPDANYNFDIIAAAQQLVLVPIRFRAIWLFYNLQRVSATNPETSRVYANGRVGIGLVIQVIDWTCRVVP